MKILQRPAVSLFRAEEVSLESMTSRRALLKMGCACCVALAAPAYAVAQTPSPEVAQHLAAAREAAGSDLGAYLVLGRSADPNFKAPAPDLEALMKIRPHLREGLSTICISSAANGSAHGRSRPLTALS
jgi:metallo-beta-lactamase class B